MSNKEKDIISTAQALNWKHNFGLAPTGRFFTEKLFEDFKLKMDILRQADKDMRSIALGNNSKGVSLVKALAEAKKAFKDSKYVDVAYFVFLINEISSEFILRGKEDLEQLKYLGKEYLSRTENPESLDFFPEEAKETEETKKAEAQALQNLYRRFFGDPMEKAYAKEIARRKAGIQRMLNTADNYIVTILSSFDKMGTAMGAGKIENWLNEFDKISKAQISFKKFIDAVYASHVKDLIEVARKANKLNEISSPKSLQELGEQVATISPQTKPETKKEEKFLEPFENLIQEEKPKKEFVADFEKEPLKNEELLTEEDEAEEIQSAIEVSDQLAEDANQLNPEESELLVEILEDVVSSDYEDQTIQDKDGNLLAIVQNNKVYFQDIQDENGSNFVVNFEFVRPLTEYVKKINMLPAYVPPKHIVKEDVKEEPVVEEKIKEEIKPEFKSEPKIETVLEKKEQKVEPVISPSKTDSTVKNEQKIESDPTLNKLKPEHVKKLNKNNVKLTKDQLDYVEKLTSDQQNKLVSLLGLGFPWDDAIASSDLPEFKSSGNDETVTLIEDLKPSKEIETSIQQPKVEPKTEIKEVPVTKTETKVEPVVEKRKRGRPKKENTKDISTNPVVTPASVSEKNKQITELEQELTDSEEVDEISKREDPVKVTPKENGNFIVQDVPSGNSVEIKSSFIDSLNKNSDISGSVENASDADVVIVLYKPGTFVGEGVQDDVSKAIEQNLGKKVLLVYGDQKTLMSEIEMLNDKGLSYYINGDFLSKDNFKFNRLAPTQEEIKKQVQDERAKWREDAMKSLKGPSKEELEAEPDIDDEEFYNLTKEQPWRSSEASNADKAFMKLAKIRFINKIAVCENKPEIAMAMIEYSSNIDEYSPNLSERLLLKAQEYLDA